MTLAVSLTVPDGLVVAADSLSTTMGRIGISAQIQETCPACKKNIELKDVTLPPIPIPASVSSFAQKVFPFKASYGIATHGIAIINEKTIYYHVRMLEKAYAERSFSGVTDVSKVILEYFDQEIRKQVKDIDKAPKGYAPLGFLVVGYDGDVGKRIEVNIGKKSTRVEHTGTGCTIGGDGQVVAKLWELGQADPRRVVKYGSFSLQDAVDYAEHLIHATAHSQRFANMIPTVGGEADIALITPFRDFAWIKCKTLTKVLESDYLGG